MRMTQDLTAVVLKADDQRRRLEFIASQEVVDRDGDVILVRGIDTSDYMQNPTFLLDHDWRQPIGKVTSLRVEDRQDGTALVAAAEVLPPGASAAADEAWVAVKFGARNGISIGFIPLEWGKPTRAGQEGVTFLKTKLVEISSVTLPSCPSCLVTAKSAAGACCARCREPKRGAAELISVERALADAFQEMARRAQVENAVREAFRGLCEGGSR